MIKVISEKPLISFKHVCTKCGFELEYTGMYLVCPRTECVHRNHIREHTRSLR